MPKTCHVRLVRFTTAGLLGLLVGGPDGVVATVLLAPILSPALRPFCSALAVTHVQRRNVAHEE